MRQYYKKYLKQVKGNILGFRKGLEALTLPPPRAGIKWINGA